MHIISIIVHDKIAVNLEKDRYVCGNSDFIIHFDFDAEWDEFDVKTARFVSESGEFIDKLFTGSDCEFPVFENTNKVLVGVFAGNLRTTTAAYVPALKSIRSASGAAVAPSDDVYDQVMKVLNEANDRSKAIEKDLQEANGGSGLFIVTSCQKEGSPLPYANRTQEEIRAAVADGKTCLLVASNKRVFIYYAETAYKTNMPYEDNCPTFISPVVYKPSEGMIYDWAQVLSDGRISVNGYHPAKTPNPYMLTLTGAVEVEYNGSKAVNVEMLPKPADTTSAAYLRWNGTKWAAATIADLKADLGLA